MSKTLTDKDTAVVNSMFQFLIGFMQSKEDEMRKILEWVFQFLIGFLQL